MTYKAYNLITLILLLGFEMRKLGAGPAIWWSAVGWGIAVLVVSLVAIGFTVTRTSDMQCPHCGGKIVARVKLGLSSGHLYLSRKEEV